MGILEKYQTKENQEAILDESNWLKMNEEELLEESEKSNGELNSYTSKVRDEISKLEDESRFLIKDEERIISSEEYNQLLKLRDKRKEIELETQKLKDRIYFDFSIFRRSFKKYKRNAKQYEKIIEDYETDTLNALLTDPELKIVVVLMEMSKSIEREEIQLKDKNVQKVMKQISIMNQQYFEDFLKEYNPIMENKERIEGEIRKNNAEEKINRIDHRQDSIKLEIDQIKQEFESEKQGLAKKLKPCPKCGKEIPVDWNYHEECGWKESKEEDEEAINNIGKVKIQVFTSPTCPHCHPALDLAKQIEKERDDVKVTELNTATPHGHRKAEQLGVMAVPTIFVKGPAYPQDIGFKGLPSKKGLLKAIDISLGKAGWEEPKGFFKGLMKKIQTKLKL